MLSKKLTALTLIILSLSPLTTLASGSASQKLPELNLAPKSEQPLVSAPSCDQVLSACDKALNSQRKLNHEQQRLIKTQDDLVITQRERIDQLTKENKSVLRSPWLWFGVGIITGVVIMK